MLNRKFIALIGIGAFTFQVHAQTVLHRTNTVGMWFADHTLTMNQGSARLNITALETPTNALNMSDISTFRATVKDLTDGRIVQTVTQDTTGENIDASQGQVRFVFSSLSDRGIDPDYEVEAYAVADDTNQNYRIHWGYLSVTSAPPATSGAVSLSLVPLTASNGSIGTASVPWGSIHAVTGAFDTLSVSNLDVAGSISAVDQLARTGAVQKIGDTMTGPLTGTAVYVESLWRGGIGITSFVGNGATIISNDATVYTTAQTEKRISEGAGGGGVGSGDNIDWTGIHTHTGQSNDVLQVAPFRRYIGFAVTQSLSATHSVTASVPLLVHAESIDSSNADVRWSLHELIRHQSTNSTYDGEPLFVVSSIWDEDSNNNIDEVVVMISDSRIKDSTLSVDRAYPVDGFDSTTRGSWAIAMRSGDIASDPQLGITVWDVGSSIADGTRVLFLEPDRIILNMDNADMDFIIEGDTSADLVHVDSNNERMGILTATPSYELDVDGDAQIQHGKIYAGTNVFDLIAGTYNGVALNP